MAIDRKSIDETLDQILACGGRAVGSDGEQRAQQVITELFREAGLDVERQAFSMSRWPMILRGRVVPLLACAALIGGAVLYSVQPVGAIIVFATTAAMIVIVQRWSRVSRALADMGRQVASENIVARTQPVRVDRPTLVLLAHYDSKSQTLPIALRMIGSKVSMVSILLLTVLGGLTTVWGPTFGWTLLLPLCGLAQIGLIMGVFNRSANLSPGALDNASGVAVILALARHLPKTVGEKANLVFVATGAEEIGLGGALRFAGQYDEVLDRDRTLCLNFDTLGWGRTIYWAGSGGPFGRLQARLFDLFEQEGFTVRRVPRFLGAGMDHMPLTGAGFSAISITQGSFRSGWIVHTDKDRAEKVDRDQLVRIVNAGAELAEQMT